MIPERKLGVALLCVFAGGLFVWCAWWAAPLLIGSSRIYGVTLLGLLALLIAVCLGGALRASAVVKTKVWTATGTAGIWVVVFSMSLAGVRSMPDSESVVLIDLIAFPADVSGRIESPFGCQVPFAPLTHSVQLALSGKCLTPPLKLWVVPASPYTQFEAGPFDAEQISQGVSLSWKGGLVQRFIGDVITGDPPSPVEGATISLVGCNSLPAVKTDGLGQFSFQPVPSTCLDSSEVRVEYRGRYTTARLKLSRHVKIRVDSILVQSALAKDDPFVALGLAPAPGGAGLHEIVIHAQEGNGAAAMFLWSANDHLAIQLPRGADPALAELVGTPASARALTPAAARERVESWKPVTETPKVLVRVASWLRASGKSGEIAAGAIEQRCATEASRIAQGLLSRQFSDKDCRVLRLYDAWRDCGSQRPSGDERLATARAMYCSTGAMRGGSRGVLAGLPE